MIENATSTETVEWGALVTLPNGALEVEPCLGRSFAERTAAIRDGRLVYRTVRYGPWHSDVTKPGGEWGMRITWPHDYVEVHPADSRRFAEMQVRNYCDSGSPELVTREVARSDWWLVGGGLAVQP